MSAYYDTDLVMGHIDQGGYLSVTSENRAEALAGRIHFSFLIEESLFQFYAQHYSC